MDREHSMFSIFTTSPGQSHKLLDQLNTVCPFIALAGSYDPNATIDSKAFALTEDCLAAIVHEVGHAIDVFVEFDDYSDKLMHNHYGVGYVTNTMRPDYTDEEVEREVNAHIISHLFAQENNILDQCGNRIMSSKEQLLEILPPICSDMQGGDRKEHWEEYIAETYVILSEYSMNIIWAEACQEAQRLREIVADLSDKKVTETY
jgi:hypothetical protein